MRPFFVCLSIALGFNINPMLMAQNAGPDMQMLIQNMQLKKGDIAKMISMLEAAGRITPEQASAAKDRLSEMEESEIKGLTMEAVSNLHGKGALSAEGNQEPKIEEKRSPASLPTSPFNQNQFKGLTKESQEREAERKKIEEIQKNMLKNAFDIKKFQ